MSDAPPAVDTATSRVIDGARQFGLSDEDIEEAVAAMTDAPVGSLLPVEAGLRAYLTGSPRPRGNSDYRRSPAKTLRAVLAFSPRGIDADAKYWNDMPQIHITESLGSRGYDAEFTDPNGGSISVLLDNDQETSINISVTNSAGLTVQTAFEYPGTSLRTNNYPALIHAINTRLLDPFGLQYVLLKTDGSRWRFVLVDSDRLRLLQRTYGEHISIDGFDSPVLEEVAIEDFLEPPIPTDHGSVPSADTTSGDLGNALLTGESDTGGEVEGATIAPSPAPNDVETMNGGVLDFEAINDATAEREVASGSVNLDEDVESVITEAETMLDDEDISETIFGTPNSQDGDTDSGGESDPSAEQPVIEIEPEDDTGEEIEGGGEDDAGTGAVDRLMSYLSSLLN